MSSSFRSQGQAEELKTALIEAARVEAERTAHVEATCLGAFREASEKASRRYAPCGCASPFETCPAPRLDRNPLDWRVKKESTEYAQATIVCCTQHAKKDSYASQVIL